ncbi:MULTISPECIES: phosphotransferase [unclassified Pseudonocardia]|uniref:phosphotransferase family protein n=1 Tax=unclassified Pseudonocardia TaxID=2619320 RepID=UPI0001FFDDFB|nr:phosphotransferase [Pseudonocardia sp. Ae707_Ps1]OLM16769.1 hypothetical protein Ae707Ps1_1027 [Pseudonocardia sp. Ae707_Ps1]
MLREQFDFLGAVAGVVSSRVTERVRPPARALDPDVPPVSVTDVTPQWLTGALCREVPGARVVDVTLGASSSGTSFRQELTVAYNDAGRAAQLPELLFTKTTPGLVHRLLVGVTGAAGAEALFYRDIRRHLDIGAPRGYHGAWDPRTCRSLVLTEDVARTRGAVFADATGSMVDRVGAESMVRELAAYHGRLWEDPRLEGGWGLRDALAWQRNFNAKTRFDTGAIVGLRLAGDEVPAVLRRRVGEVRAAFMRSLELNVGLPRTLLHHDVHPGNWFALPSGELHLYDWQGIASGNWALDYSYAISAGLSIEDRRSWERELLALYLDELGAAGGSPPSFDDAWLAYRQQMFHGLILWAYTFLVGKVAELQRDAHVRTLIRRTGAAVVDLESLDSLNRTPAP